MTQLVLWIWRKECISHSVIFNSMLGYSVCMCTLSEGHVILSVKVMWYSQWRSCDTLSEGHVILLVKVMWYSQWRSCDTLNEGHVILSVKVMWYSQWRSCDTLSEGHVILDLNKNAILKQTQKK